MSSRKRLEKNMTQIENQDDLRLIANHPGFCVLSDRHRNCDENQNHSDQSAIKREFFEVDGFVLFFRSDFANVDFALFEVFIAFSFALFLKPSCHQMRMKQDVNHHDAKAEKTKHE